MPFAHAAVKDGCAAANAVPLGILDRRSTAGGWQAWPNGKNHSAISNTEHRLARMTQAWRSSGATGVLT
jgi:hypothetical protein